MRNCLGIAIGIVSMAALPLAGQGAKSAIARMPDGHPDLQGTYDLATITPLERAQGDPPSYTKEKAEELEKALAARRAKDYQDSRPDRPVPPVGGGGGSAPAPASYLELVERAAGGAVGGYNRFWLGQGTTYTVVDGQIRTSIVIDPPNGRIPPLNAAGRQRVAA